MIEVYFDNEELDYDNENESLHSYTISNELPVIPVVGDHVDFDDDALYKHREALGTLFVVTTRRIMISRVDDCHKNCSVMLTVEPVEEPNGDSK